VEPGGAFYAFPSVAEHLRNGIADSNGTGEAALTPALVVVPGRLRYAGYLRIFMHSDDRIRRRPCGALRIASRWVHGHVTASSRFWAGACKARPIFMPHWGRTGISPLFS